MELRILNEKKSKIIGVCVFLGLGLFFCIYYYQRMIAKENAKPRLNKNKGESGIIAEEIPEKIWDCLYQPKEMVLFSLDPDQPNEEILKSKENALFHEYLILGSTKILSKEDQNIVADEIKYAVYGLGRGVFLCFEPRHGVRITDGKNTYDYLICFECGSMHVFYSENSYYDIMIGGNKDVLDKILINAKVPLPVSQK